MSKGTEAMIYLHDEFELTPQMRGLLASGAERVLRLTYGDLWQMGATNPHPKKGGQQQVGDNLVKFFVAVPEGGNEFMRDVTLHLFDAADERGGVWCEATVAIEGHITINDISAHSDPTSLRRWMDAIAPREGN